MGTKLAKKWGLSCHKTGVGAHPIFMLVSMTEGDTSDAGERRLVSGQVTGEARVPGVQRTSGATAPGEQGDRDLEWGPCRWAGGKTEPVSCAGASSHLLHLGQSHVEGCRFGERGGVTVLGGDRKSMHRGRAEGAGQMQALLSFEVFSSEGDPPLSTVVWFSSGMFRCSGRWLAGLRQDWSFSRTILGEQRQ